MSFLHNEMLRNVLKEACIMCASRDKVSLPNYMAVLKAAVGAHFFLSFHAESRCHVIIYLMCI